MTPRLELRRAAVRFGPATAIDGVDLAVETGEVVTILGPSGSGKSTMLRVLAGLQPLDEGEVMIDGHDAAAIPPHRRDVGMMFQDHALFPHLDVGGNVAFGLRMQRWDRRRVAARVAELLEMVGLPGTEHRTVHTLSGGEQQRVALARSLAPGPGALLLDEPLGALDRPLRERLVRELRGVFVRLGLTVVAVTHDHDEAFALADRIAIIDQGRLLQTGSAAEVWRAPASAAVARLLGFTNLAPLAPLAPLASAGSAGSASGPWITPWGDLGRAGAAPAWVLVRPEGVRPDPDGPLVGTVVDAAFAGARGTIRVTFEDGVPDLDAELTGDAVPKIGTRVRLRIDPAAVTWLPG